MFKTVEAFNNHGYNGISLNDLREKMSNRLLIGGFLITFIELLLFISMESVDYKTNLIIVYVIIYSMGAFSLFRESSISSNDKGKILLIFFYLLGSVTYIVSSGISSIMMFTFGLIISLIYFKKRSNLYYIMLVCISLLLLGILFTPKLDLFIMRSDILSEFAWIMKSLYISSYLFTLYAAIILLLTYTMTAIRELEKVALFDTLTNLPNKLQFKKSLNRIINDSKVESFGVLYIDLDNFKKINDVFGRFTGDRILNIVAKRLKRLEYKEDLFARISGDEFILLIKNKIHKKISHENIEKLRQSIEKPIVIDGISYEIKASYGYSLYPKDGLSAEVLIQKSEIAMRKAKISESDDFKQYTDQMKASINLFHKIENELEKNLNEGIIKLVYQPQVDVETEEIVGFEVLSRFSSASLGIISPEIFIPILEESGLIVKYGELLIEEAVKKLKVFEKISNRHYKMAINISAMQLNQPNFLVFLKSILEKYHVNYKSLELEITESLLIKNRVETNEILKKIREIGINISLDDFGTGYSSLSYLMDLELDQLKIDKSFINQLENDSTKENILESIIKMAHVLSFEVVAEGVENENQLEIIRSKKCNYVQGYYYYRPLSSDKIIEILED
ncbi:MAG TPA: bifunctional diguanylate cyclase/phosphodiesterase [Clostridia bacterium]|nr:bifunctional diguanylate cyclase/phosphodiesterase [Clostridia bacterium]